MKIIFSSLAAFILLAISSVSYAVQAIPISESMFNVENAIFSPLINAKMIDTTATQFHDGSSVTLIYTVETPHILAAEPLDKVTAFHQETMTLVSAPGEIAQQFLSLKTTVNLGILGKSVFPKTAFKFDVPT